MDKLSPEEILVEGSKHKLTVDSAETNKPMVIRGVIKKHHADNCVKENRDYWYIDTGYFGNFPSPGNKKGGKKWHRIVKNENQLSTFRPDIPYDRWNMLVEHDPRLIWKGWKNYDKKILLVMPNPKACVWYDIDYDKWVKQTTKKIKQYCDLPIEVRIKGSRTERNFEYSIYDAFESGVYATVAMNSMAALESVLYGVPAFVSVPCAASPLASTDLSQLSNPYRPETDKILQHCHSLAYGQFTFDEVEQGRAYKLVEKYS